MTFPHIVVELLKSLPFEDEQLEMICDESDVVLFLSCYTIYFGEDEAALFADYVNESNLLSIAIKLFPDKLATAKATVVGALKYSFAYNRTATGVTSFDCVNAVGLPYLAEAETDLACALQWMSTGHYKQANQLLRSALEAAVTHAYFSAVGVTYYDLPARTIPPMKDNKRGMLNQLITSHVVCASEADFMTNLYGDLSDATHSQYKYLENKFEKTDESEIFAYTLQHIREVSMACLTVVLNTDRMGVHSTVDLRIGPNG